MLKAEEVAQQIDWLLAGTALAADFSPIKNAIKLMQFKKALTALEDFTRQLTER